VVVDPEHRHNVTWSPEGMEVNSAAFCESWWYYLVFSCFLNFYYLYFWVRGAQNGIIGTRPGRRSSWQLLTAQSSGLKPRWLR